MTAITGANARSTLKRHRRAGDPMDAYDRLPPELRAWLSGAALPWSARSALRLWRKTLRDAGGDAAEARQRLSGLERRQIARDARRIWGAAHPAAEFRPRPPSSGREAFQGS